LVGTYNIEDYTGDMSGAWIEIDLSDFVAVTKIKYFFMWSGSTDRAIVYAGFNAGTYSQYFGNIAGYLMILEDYGGVYDEGYVAGYYGGYYDGNNYGYDEGLTYGYLDGYSDGYDDGWDDKADVCDGSYNLGYDAGWGAGMETIDALPEGRVGRFFVLMTLGVKNIFNIRVYEGITFGTFLFFPLLLSLIMYVKKLGSR